MAYSTSNPPGLISSQLAGKGQLWLYKSADAETDYDDSGYITNAEDLGMETGDAVIVIDTTNGLTSMGKVTVASGAGTLSAFTAIS
jgi:hypothetical protein